MEFIIILFAILIIFTFFYFVIWKILERYGIFDKKFTKITLYIFKCSFIYLLFAACVEYFENIYIERDVAFNSLLEDFYPSIIKSFLSLYFVLFNFFYIYEYLNKRFNKE